jgi:hypothetical protein
MPEEPYLEFLAEREELLRRKWLLSEKAGQDVGFEVTLIDWAFHHRTQWRQQRSVVGEEKSATVSR